MENLPPGASRDFLARPSIAVAPELLGCVIRHETADGIVAVRISEVEAYMGSDDPGSHAYRGKTARNATMFNEAGHLYVYRHLGLHHCVNVVCGVAGIATGALVRAGEIVEGIDLARRRRMAAGVVRRDRDLARGPARLAVAMGFDLRYNGVDVISGAQGVRLLRRTAAPAGICTGPRVGVSGAGGDGDHYPWRFWIAEDPTVSDYRRHVPKNG